MIYDYRVYEPHPGKMAAFNSDPEWLRLVAESEADGPLVARVFNSLLKPTDYSPAQ
ncbi:MAG: hypothetical protein IH956_05700 [Chloroflexi bacterium]|nr:hypothetical protein [Chloroflexota bacterium]